MTATPIPRTLTLTAYGDMDVSRLDEKPPGRKPIDTLLIPGEKMEDMIAGLKRQIESGARVYWVCPLVEESEKIDLAAAQERYDVLVHFFGANKIGLIHGRMKGEEKDTVMAKFIAGETSILVATTVIEVGVNVPEATIMVIEHAERFGLSITAHSEKRRKSALPQCARPRMASSLPRRICNSGGRAIF